MFSPRNVIMAGAASIFLLTCSSASAGEPAARLRVLVTNFDVSSRVPGLDTNRGAPLASQLEFEFAKLAVQASSDHSVNPAPSPAPFLRIAGVRVPAWMRAGALVRSPEALGIAPTAVSTCAARRYIPSSLLGRNAEERRQILYPLVQRAACEAGLPIGLMDAMLIQESRYNPLALSPKGAFGLGQLMPGTARQLGVDRYDLRGNLTGAARYLRQHIDEFRQVPLALAAYNAGPGRVRKAGRIPRIVETQNYVRQILMNWRTLEGRRARPNERPSSPLPRQASVVSRFP